MTELCGPAGPPTDGRCPDPQAIQTMDPILLIHPPVAKAGEPPAGIALLAAALGARNVPCTLLDANLEAQMFLLGRANAPPDTWSTRALRRRDEHLAALRTPALYANPDRYRRAVADTNRLLELAAASHPGVRISLSDYADETRSPLASDDLLRAAAEYEASLFHPWYAARLPGLLEETGATRVGISLCFLSQALPTFALLGFLRARWPGLTLVLGGGLVTSWMSRPGWQNPFAGLVDHCIAGPGEGPLLDLLGAGPPPADLAPDYTGLPLADYLAPGPILPYAASRGCYWNRCRFCPEPAEKSRWQEVAPATVVRHLHALRAQYQPVLLHLLDNALSPGLLRALADDPPGAPWYGFVRVHEQLADPAFCERLRASGCVLLKLGLESGSQAVLDAMAKGIRLELMERTLGALSRAGIATYVYLLFGTPSESLVEARQTLDFTRRHHEAITFLNLAVFNMPVASDEAAELPGESFSDGDLSLYRDFVHPRGWDRRAVRTFLDREFKRQPEIAAILRRDPLLFTSNHAAFFTGHFPSLDGEGIKS